MNGSGAQAFSALHGVTVPTPPGFQGFIVLNPKMDVKAVSLLLRAKGDSAREAPAWALSKWPPVHRSWPATPSACCQGP